jgi:hypothetical protein
MEIENAKNEKLLYHLTELDIRMCSYLENTRIIIKNICCLYQVILI